MPGPRLAASYPVSAKERGGNVKSGETKTTAAPAAFDDPLPSLPGTARNLLLAAKRIIATEGFHALTLNAVAAASGENKAMIAYYFGNKAGLVAAVLDAVIHDDYVASLRRMNDLDPERRGRQLVEEIGRMASAADEFRVFFELLPDVLRDDALRARMAQLYRWYWNIKLQWLGRRRGMRSTTPSCSASPSSCRPSSTGSRSRLRSTPRSTSPTRCGCWRRCCATRRCRHGRRWRRPTSARARRPEGRDRAGPAARRRLTKAAGHAAREGVR